MAHRLEIEQHPKGLDLPIPALRIPEVSPDGLSKSGEQIYDNEVNARVTRGPSRIRRGMRAQKNPNSGSPHQGTKTPGLGEPTIATSTDETPIDTSDQGGGGPTDTPKVTEGGDDPRRFAKETFRAYVSGATAIEHEAIKIGIDIEYAGANLRMARLDTDNPIGVQNALEALNSEYRKVDEVDKNTSEIDAFQRFLKGLRQTGKILQYYEAVIPDDQTHTDAWHREESAVVNKLAAIALMKSDFESFESPDT